TVPVRMTMSPAPPFAHGTNCGKLRGTWTFVVFVTACARADVGTASTRTKITVSVRFFTIANPVMVASCLPSEIGERNSVWGLRLWRRVPASEQREPLDGAKPLGKDGRCQAHFPEGHERLDPAFPRWMGSIPVPGLGYRPCDVAGNGVLAS